MKGFTLLETLIVLIISSIVAGALVSILRPSLKYQTEAQVALKMPGLCKRAGDHFKIYREMTNVINFLPNDFSTLFNISSNTTSGGIKITISTKNTYSGNVTVQGVQFIDGRYFAECVAYDQIHGKAGLLLFNKSEKTNYDQVKINGYY